MGELKIGQRVTLLRISHDSAMTHRFELEIRQVLEPAAVGYEGREQRVAIVRQRGKRKDFYLDLGADNILLDGWDVPFKTDVECSGVFSGNACFNFVGDADAIRLAIETKAVFPVTDRAKAMIVVSAGPRTRCDDSEVSLLYPDIDIDHAVINRMKEDQCRA